MSYKDEYENFFYFFYFFVFNVFISLRVFYGNNTLSILNTPYTQDSWNHTLNGLNWPTASKSGLAVGTRALRTQVYSFQNLPPIAQPKPKETSPFLQPSSTVLTTCVPLPQGPHQLHKTCLSPPAPPSSHHRLTFSCSLKTPRCGNCRFPFPLRISLP